METLFFYQAYGLNIRSDFPLFELIPGGTGEDLYIQKGKVILPTFVPTSISRQGIEALFGGNSESACLRWPGIVTLLAEKGNTLTVAPDFDNIDPQFLSLFIVSEALGLILYQRGLFLLHASAVIVKEGAIVFVGTAGAGKSTTAAAFARAGHVIIADDMVAINFNATDDAVVFPASPLVKIWSSSVAGLGYDISSLPTLYSDSRKYFVWQQQDFLTASIPLISIYILQDSEDIKITKITGIVGFFSLLKFFPCPSGVLEGEGLLKHFYQLEKLIKKISLMRLERPRSFSVFKDLVNQVKQESHLHGVYR